MKKISVVLLLLIIYACTTIYTKKDFEKATLNRNYSEIFKNYYKAADEKEENLNTAIEDFLLTNQFEATSNILIVLADSKNDPEVIKGAIMIASFLKIQDTLPLIEGFLSDKDWNIRYLSASAINTLNNPSSLPSIVKAIPDETHPLVVLYFAKYLQINPPIFEDTNKGKELISKKGSEMLELAKKPGKQRGLYSLAWFELERAQLILSSKLK